MGEQLSFLNIKKKKGLQSNGMCTRLSVCFEHRHTDFKDGTSCSVHMYEYIDLFAGWTIKEHVLDVSQKD